MAEDFDGVLRWRGGQCDLHGVKVIEDASVGGDVIGLGTDFQFAFAHFTVEDVTPVCFIDDDAVVAVDGDVGAITKNSAHHALHRGNLNFGGRVRFDVTQLLYIVDFGEYLVLFQAHVLEGVLGLLAE